jgi:hypothetical protein
MCVCGMQLIETAFGENEEQLDEGDRFLKRYLLNKVIH